MQSKFRLTRSEDFKRVRRSGKSYAHPLVILIAQANDGSQTRIGVAAGRTVGGAVHRNRAKRLLREAMRTLIPNLAPGLNLILIARPGLSSSSMQDAQKILILLLQRAQAINPSHES